MYTFIIDELKARILSERQIAATFMAAGADMEMPDLDVEILKFDEWLVSEPQPPKEVDPKVYALRRALGLRV